jgi:hypothetical protein
MEQEKHMIEEQILQKIAHLVESTDPEMRNLGSNIFLGLDFEVDDIRRLNEIRNIPDRTHMDGVELPFPVDIDIFKI